MATRYLPGSPFAIRDNRGIHRVLNPDYVNREDGLPGYTEEQIKGLPPQAIASLRSFTIEGGPKSVPDDVEDEVVETATAEPGVKRTVATPKAVKAATKK